MREETFVETNLERPTGEALPSVPPQTDPTPQAPVVVIPRVMFNYVVIALVCLVVGAVVGMVAYDRVAKGSAAANDELIDRAVATVVAALPRATTPPPTVDPNIRYDISIEGQPSIGPLDAPVVMVEFGDFRCTYCKRFHDETIEPLLQNYGDKVLFVYRDYPILGPDSIQAALAAECAFDQGAFWGFHDRLYAAPTALTRDNFILYAQDLQMNVDTFTKCYDDAEHQDLVTGDFNAGTAVGVGATPTFFINGKLLLGAQPYDQFAARIDAELAAAESSAAAS
jgi:protein-disulfide isomerase